MTSSAISGRSSPSTRRAVVDIASAPSSIRLAIVERSQPLDAARDRELRLQRVRNLVSSMREPVRVGEDGLAVEVDADRPGEIRLASKGDEGGGVHTRGR